MPRFPSSTIPRSSPSSRAPLALWVVLAACMLPVMFTAAPAQAQTAAELSDARAKFQQAIELEQAGNWAGALRAFREVGQVKMTPQIRYHIAVCEENLGQLVTALGGYELALEQSEGMHPDFIAEVKASVDELNARIPKLVIERGEGAEAATIELDGVAIGEAQVGLEIPLNPGPHAVVATAPGYERFQHTVTVEAGSVSTISVPLVRIKKPQPPQTTTAPPPRSMGLTPYIVGGAGLGLMVIGGVLLGVSQGKASQVKERCGGGIDCTSLVGTERDDAMQLFNTAKGLEAGGWVTFGLGAAALATGTVLFFIDKKNRRSDKSTAWRVLPTAPASDAGLSLSTSF